MLRVLALSSLYPSDSAPNLGKFIERQMAGLAARPDVTVSVVAPGDPPIAPFDSSARFDDAVPRVARIRSVKAGTRSENVPRALADAVVPLAEEIRDRDGIDVLTAELLWPDGPAMALVARALRLPFSIKARGHEFDRFERHRALLGQARDAAQEAAGLLAVSSALRERMGAHGFPLDRIAVHYTGVDRDRFKPRDRAAAKAELKVDGPLLVAVGNLTPRKGHELVIDAVARLPRVSLFIAGAAGSEMARLKSRIAALGLERRVRMLGHVPHLMLPALISAADATVLASSREGLANVWVESLACGTPVVTTDVDGARDAIDRPAAGRIVARNPEAIAAAVAELLADPPNREAVRAASDRFSWSRNAEELESHLRKIAEAAASGRGGHP
jgi:glycosyltransferase involved in cell wall biosynthesis